ncbi:cysteine-rich CWC family protein [Variovorax sp. PCZ-1]|uniref:cysteine-rich CWC family protein n=1 Tax=Variovorax sp. PCZ-1 TaxID=2835533 RepID=UPI001BCB58BD|nr:cysteine-rich CWC family protein [Variovorax sp. PCZ-1]MBS7809183.1 cysteine-rich CWC family protein [Variovorax sp. PCZ-1]
MSEATSSINQSLCPLCGKVNQCAMEIEKVTGEKQPACWCVGMDFSVDLLAKLPLEAQGKACICANCASNKAQALDT